MRLGAQHGQAAAELVALLPLVTIIGALLWQLALAGHATWAAGAAARAAARASAIGRDAQAAARGALPADLRAGMQVAEGADGTIRVSIAIPALAPGLHLGSASARARFPGQDR